MQNFIIGHVAGQITSVTNTLLPDPRIYWPTAEKLKEKYQKGFHSKSIDDLAKNLRRKLANVRGQEVKIPKVEDADPIPQEFFEAETLRLRRQKIKATKTKGRSFRMEIFARDYRLFRRQDMVFF